MRNFWLRASAGVGIALLLGGMTVEHDKRRNIPVIVFEPEDLVLYGRGNIDTLLSVDQAQAGDPEARYLLALARFAKKTKLIDDAQAWRWLEAAADAGHMKARALLAAVLIGRKDATIPERYRGQALARLAAVQGRPNALVAVAHALDRTNAPEGQRVAALAWYLLAASQGYETDTEVRKLRAGLDARAQARAEAAVLGWRDPLPKAIATPPAVPPAPLTAPRPARRCDLQPLAADAPAAWLTQLGGAPWWPAGEPRPRCAKHAQPQAFLAQVRLADVPGLAGDPGLLSLHLCPDCWDVGDEGKDPGLTIRLLAPGPADGRGRADEAEVLAGRPRYSAVVDQASYEDEAPPPKAAGFDPVAYGRPWATPVPTPALPHLDGDKLGGWPSWVQQADWPRCEEGRTLRFVGQFSEHFAPDFQWGSGGFVYMFVCPPECQRRRGAIVMQSS